MLYFYIIKNKISSLYKKSNYYISTCSLLNILKRTKQVPYRESVLLCILRSVLLLFNSALSTVIRYLFNLVIVGVATSGHEIGVDRINSIPEESYVIDRTKCRQVKGQTM
jgi:hypothetical protein